MITLNPITNCTNTRINYPSHNICIYSDLIDSDVPPLELRIGDGSPSWGWDIMSRTECPNCGGNKVDISFENLMWKCVDCDSIGELTDEEI